MRCRKKITGDREKGGRDVRGGIEVMKRERGGREKREREEGEKRGREEEERREGRGM